MVINNLMSFFDFFFFSSGKKERVTVCSVLPAKIQFGLLSTPYPVQSVFVTACFVGKNIMLQRRHLIVNILIIKCTFYNTSAFHKQDAQC